MAIVTDWLVVAVRDHGPGLTQAQCTQAAEPFWRGQRQVEGTGLGVSIVATSAARHGGMLALEPAAGSCLNLPLADAPAIPRKASSCDPGTGQAGPTPA